MIIFRFAAAAAFATFALLSTPGPTVAQANDPEARKLAQQLFDLTITSGLTDSMVEGSWPPLEQTLRQNPLKLSDVELAKLKTDYTGILKTQLDQTMAEAPQIYAKYFSAAELKDMLAFYETGTGRKTLQVMPAMTQEIMARTQEQAPAMFARIMASFQAILKERGIKTP